MNKRLNTTVIYHYNDDDSSYKKEIYKKSTAHNLTKTAPSERGFVSANICKIRIFTQKPLDIAPGDYVLVCTSRESLYAANIPDKSKCKKVMAVSDNRIGCRPHWRIDAE